jgi:tRNA(Ile)-lysidine synthase
MAAHRRINWRKAAEAMAAEIPIERLDPAVRRWAETGEGREARRWAIALSGGADSVALMLLVWAHWPKHRRRLVALHFDHQLRGAAAARGDRQFCGQLCRQLGVRLAVAKWQRSGRGEQASEAEARAARMAFFEKHSAVIWLGHHLDDVAETMLMRLARGSGTAGLSAPRPLQIAARERVHLRPLLSLRKAELQTTLKKAGATWREDRTNAGPTFFRNRIRRDVIPAWLAAAGRDAVAGAGRSRELLAEDDAALEERVAQLSPLGAHGTLLLRRLGGEPRAIWRRSLHRWIGAQERVIDVSRQAFDALLDAIMAGKPTRHSLGSEVFAVLRGGSLVCEGGKSRSKFHRRVN